MHSALFFDERSSRLFLTFNYQLTVLEMKPEIKNRIMSHDKPVVAALYNSTFNQVGAVAAILFHFTTSDLFSLSQHLFSYSGSHLVSFVTGILIEHIRSVQPKLMALLYKFY